MRWIKRNVHIPILVKVNVKNVMIPCYFVVNFSSYVRFVFPSSNTVYVLFHAAISKLYDESHLKFEIVSVYLIDIELIELSLLIFFKAVW